MLYTTDICGICRDTLTMASTETSTLACAHVFHTECIDAWTRRVNQCPFCRAPVKSRAVADDIYSHTLAMYDDEPEAAIFVDDGFTLDRAIAIDGEPEIDWEHLSQRRGLSEAEMREFMDVVYPYVDPDVRDAVILNFTIQQELSPDFVRDYFIELDIDLVAELQTHLSPEFRAEIGIDPPLSDFDGMASYMRFHAHRDMVRELLGM